MENRLITTMRRQYSRVFVLRRLLLLLVALGSWLSAVPAKAFALLGPYADWMDVTNGFRQLNDIGGPMDIKEGYRWNVPVLSYGFDESFLGYFGSNGVAAVKTAIAIMNSLPPASAVVLTNYPFDSRYHNYQAEAQNLYDLKSAALSIIAEHLGLAQPVRSIFILRRWNPILNSLTYLGAGPPWPDGVVPNFIIERNYDPQTLATSYVVNGTLYAGYVEMLALGTNGIPTEADVAEYQVDPLATGIDAVAELVFDAAGLFYAGLTYDDVGGLSYLLSTNNIVFETLLPDVHPVDTNQVVVNGAWRPGVDKITLIQHPFDPGTATFTPLTNEFTDSYLINGQLLHQQLKRVIEQPDFLFSCADTGKQNRWSPFVVRSGTTNWINNASLNGSAFLGGPGVITPPVTISFGKFAGWVLSSEPTPELNSDVVDVHWGSFDQSTNTPVEYPDFSTQTNWPLTLRLRLFSGGSNSAFVHAFDWQVPIPIGGTVLLQSSTNLMDWVSVNTVTNKGGVIEWFHQGTSQSRRFFRVMPQ